MRCKDPLQEAQAALNRETFERERREANADRGLVWLWALPALTIWAFARWILCE